MAERVLVLWAAVLAVEEPEPPVAALAAAFPAVACLVAVPSPAEACLAAAAAASRVASSVAVDIPEVAEAYLAEASRTAPAEVAFRNRAFRTASAEVASRSQASSAAVVAEVLPGVSSWASAFLQPWPLRPWCLRWLAAPAQPVVFLHPVFVRVEWLRTLVALPDLL